MADPETTLPKNRAFLRTTAETRSHVVALVLSYGVASAAHPNAAHQDSPIEPPTSGRHIGAVEPATEAVRALWQTFADLSSLQPGWDGEDAEPPQVAARDTMHAVLEQLTDAGLVPQRLNADVDGGLSAYFFHPGRGHVSIHCDNDGAVVLVDDDPQRTVQAVEIDAQSPEVIESFVRARASARASG